MLLTRWSPTVFVFTFVFVFAFVFVFVCTTNFNPPNPNSSEVVSAGICSPITRPTPHKKHICSEISHFLREGMFLMIKQTVSGRRLRQVLVRTYLICLTDQPTISIRAQHKCEVSLFGEINIFIEPVVIWSRLRRHLWQAKGPPWMMMNKI